MSADPPLRSLPPCRSLEPTESIRPAVVVLPAVSFDPPLDELGPWLDRLSIADAISIPGADAPLYLTDDAVALTTSGMGKSAAATTVAAMHGAPGLDLSSTYWLSAGIAGAAPDRAALGSVVLADVVLDWDRKHRWDPAEVSPDRRAARDEPAVEPLAYFPEGSLWELDPDLVERAVAVAREVDLVDRSDVREAAEGSPNDVGGGPRTGVGPTVTSDEFWHGTSVAREVEAFCDAYAVGPYATTQMEDAGTATALSRFGALDRHLSVRAVANYDRPAPGQTVHDSFEGSPETVEQATENAARVGRAVVDWLLDGR